MLRPKWCVPAFPWHFSNQRKLLSAVLLLGKNEQGPVGDHKGLCSIKYTGRSVSQGQFWWPYLLYVWSQHPSALVRRIPTATGLRFLSFTSTWTLYCWWDGQRPSMVLLGTWMSWPSSPAGACGALLCRSHSWAVNLQWLEFLPGVWHLLSLLGTPPWLKCWSGLLQFLLCYPEPQPQAHETRGCFQNQRGALNAECYSGLPSSTWVISLPSTPKKAMFGLSRCCKQHCCENATLYTWYSTENQKPADGGWRNTCCKTQVVRGARAAHALPSPSCATLRKPFNWCFEEPCLLHLYFAACFSEGLHLKILNEFWGMVHLVWKEQCAVNWVHSLSLAVIGFGYNIYITSIRAWNGMWIIQSCSNHHLNIL